MVTSTAPLSRPALISRGWDFWLLGGASLLLWLPFFFLLPATSQTGGDAFVQAVVTMSAVDLLVNQPHLLASYHLAYGRGRAFVLKHWFHTLFVPIALILAFVWAFTMLGRPEGALVLGGAVNFMFLCSGWHYTKQAFGVTMVYAAYDGYSMQRWQRELIRYSLLALWIYSFARGAGGPDRGGVYAMRWNLWLPDWVAPVTGSVLLVLVVGVLLGVVARNWRERRPSLNMVTPYLAIFFWFVPWLRPYAFYQLGPVFHGMQYLPFVYRVERFRSPGLKLQMAWLGLVGLMAVGWMVMKTIPGVLDGWMAGPATQLSFFVVAAGVFCNVHHIFLDNALWRLGEDRDVRQALIH